MGAFVKTTRTCAVAALGLSLSLGIAVSGDPSAAVAAPTVDQQQSGAIVVTSPTDVVAESGFVISGSAAADTTVWIYGLLDAPIVEVRTDGAGAFRYEATKGLPAGVRQVIFSTPKAERVVEFRVRAADGVVPELTPLTIDEPTWAAGERVTLSGRATPGAKILMEVRTASVAGTEVTVDRDGRWTVTTKQELTGAEHELSVRQTTEFGSETKRVSVRAETDAKRPLTVDAPEYVQGRTVTLRGSATPGATVRATFQTANVAPLESRVGADGRWSVTTSFAITGPDHEVRVRQYSQFGDEAPQTVRLVAEASASSPLRVDDPEYVPGQPLTLSGTATPGNTIDIRAYSANVFGTAVRVGADGAWSFTTPAAVTGPAHEVSVRQVETGEAPVRLTLEADTSAAKPVRASTPRYEPGKPLTLSGTGTPGATIDIRAYSAGIDRTDVTVAADGSWAFTTAAPVTGLRHEVRVHQNSVHGTDSTTVVAEARDANGDPVRFRALERTSDTTYVPGGTTRLTGTATPFADVRVELSNPGNKPLPGGTSARYDVRVAADGTWSVDIPAHRLVGAAVKQYGELGNDSLQFEFTKA